MKLLRISAAIILLFTSCDKRSDKPPACLDNKISEFRKNAACNDPKVNEYSFQNTLVYVFDPGTCGADMSSEVIDSNCQTIGHLGGITGNTKINGEEFSHAKFKRTIWKK